MQQRYFVAAAVFAAAAFISFHLSRSNPPEEDSVPRTSTLEHDRKQRVSPLSKEAVIRPKNFSSEATMDSEVEYVPVATRDPDEWQAMPPPTQRLAACDTSERCGLALACIDGKCQGCLVDGDCAFGESCALQHCVERENVDCTTRLDCASDELCVLSGYSPGARGNAGMTATCLPLRGGEEQVLDDELRALRHARGKREPRPYDPSTLRDGLVHETGEAEDH